MLFVFNILSPEFRASIFWTLLYFFENTFALIVNFDIELAKSTCNTAKAILYAPQAI